jgi:hypothetical protein
VLSGTSMSAPHVAGIAASLIYREGKFETRLTMHKFSLSNQSGNVTPVDMSLKLKSLALQNVVAGVRELDLLGSPSTSTDFVILSSELHIELTCL